MISHARWRAGAVGRCAGAWKPKTGTESGLQGPEHASIHAEKYQNHSELHWYNQNWYRQKWVDELLPALTEYSSRNCKRSNALYQRLTSESLVQRSAVSLRRFPKTWRSLRLSIASTKDLVP